jgi:cobyrinic acid a,c-diamide synthase
MVSGRGGMVRIVIAAPASGSGKTTVTLGIMAALCKRGLQVAPFKVGPDFIDPGYHRLATGATSVNLDGWICRPGFIRDTFDLHAAGCGIAVIEGVMGLFDGVDGSSEAGSTAQLAKLVGAPVVLVLDARSQARSAAAVLHGCATFDPELQLAGVIFNNVASENHERILRDAVATALPGIAVIGCLPRDPKLAIPSRHLGLCTADENPLSDEFLSYLVEVTERHLDLERLLALDPVSLPGRRFRKGNRVSASKPRFSGRPALPVVGWRRRRQNRASAPLETAPSVRREGPAASPVPLPPNGTPPALRPLPFQGRDGVGMGSSPLGTAAAPVRIAVARDAAFCFMYEDNLRLLREQGAEICFFSPLTSSGLPDDISGIYLPGGYPELFAPALAANEAVKAGVRAAIEAGMPVYAECGGFIYLTGGVEAAGEHHPFVGIFPVQTRMLPKRKALGYRQVDLIADSIIGPTGSVARGHEFHYSEMEPMPGTVQRIYEVSKNQILLGREGFRHKNCLASYIHLHFGSSPQIAATFVGHCRAFSTGSPT